MSECDVTPIPVNISCDNIQEKDEISMTISAPGKVILYGEHSVVYGKLAIAASLDLRTKLFFNENEFKEDQPNYIKVELPAINLVHVYDLKELRRSLFIPELPLTTSPSNYNWMKPELIDYNKLLCNVVDYINRSTGSIPLTSQQHLSLCSLFYLVVGIFASVNVDLKPFVLRVETELSINSGSGSSASYSVTIAAACVHYLRLLISKRKVGEISKNCYKSVKALHVNFKQFAEQELETISKWAYISEKIIMHGSLPSGIDNTVCTYGSLVEFRKATGAKFLKFNSKLRLLLINTNVKRDTKQLVSIAVALKERYPSIVEHILHAMDEVAHKAVGFLLSIDNNPNNELGIESSFCKLGELTNINQHLLETLGVSHSTLDKICRIVKKFKLSAKLTGAGGGGYAIALIPPYLSNDIIDQLINKLEQKGFESTLTNLAGKGVTLDSCNMDLDSL